MADCSRRACARIWAKIKPLDSSSKHSECANDATLSPLGQIHDAAHLRKRETLERSCEQRGKHVQALAGLLPPPRDGLLTSRSASKVFITTQVSEPMLAASPVGRQTSRQAA